jgi:hypothetical protein
MYLFSYVVKVSFLVQRKCAQWEMSELQVPREICQLCLCTPANSTPFNRKSALWKPKPLMPGSLISESDIEDMRTPTAPVSCASTWQRSQCTNGYQKYPQGQGAAASNLAPTTLYPNMGHGLAPCQPGPMLVLYGRFGPMGMGGRSCSLGYCTPAKWAA